MGLSCLRKEHMMTGLPVSSLVRRAWAIIASASMEAYRNLEMKAIAVGFGGILVGSMTVARFHSSLTPYVVHSEI